MIFDYSALSQLWNFPSRYYSVDVTAVGVSMRIIVLNTNPCVSSYVGGGSYGGTNEFLTTARPAARRAPAARRWRSNNHHLRARCAACVPPRPTNSSRTHGGVTLAAGFWG